MNSKLGGPPIKDYVPLSRKQITITRGRLDEIEDADVKSFTNLNIKPSPNGMGLLQRTYQINLNPMN